MPRDGANSHRRVLAAAREEFSARGYENASMRKIGLRSGMTAAGLYRHFESKAALFRAVVSPAAAELRRWTEETLPALSERASGPFALWRAASESLARELVSPMAEDFRLLFVRSAGTEYAEALGALAGRLAEALLALWQDAKPPEMRELRFLTEASLRMLLEPALGGDPPEAARAGLRTEAFLLAGWRQIAGGGET